MMLTDEETPNASNVTVPGPESFHGILPWFAVRVREKFRTATEDSLSAQGFTLFSPMTAELRQWSDRIKAVSAPLFAGYLFCCFDPQKQLPILRTLGVIDIVRSGKYLAEVDPTELEAVYKALHADPQIAAIPYLSQGERVRVTQGPLRDVEGILTNVKSRCTLVLAVTMMNRSVAVQIDRTHVELI